LKLSRSARKKPSRSRRKKFSLQKDLNQIFSLMLQGSPIRANRRLKAARDLLLGSGVRDVVDGGDAGGDVRDRNRPRCPAIQRRFNRQLQRNYPSPLPPRFRLPSLRRPIVRAL